MKPWEGSDKKPCGTMAAVRRHYRHREPLCRLCRQAQRRFNELKWDKKRQ